MYDYFTGQQSWQDYVSNRDLAKRIESSVVKVGNGIRLEMQTAANTVSQAVSQGFGSVIDGLDDGLSQLSCEIRDVSMGTADLRSDFHLLMGEVVWKLELQNATLVSLLTTLQAPLDTAARELRRRAEYAYENGWYDEALRDLLASEEKNYQDFAVHRSIANIYLYRKVDIPQAFQYFLKAAKYAAPRDTRQTAEAQFLASVCAGLKGDFNEGLQRATDATTLNPAFYEAYYYRAGFAGLLSKASEAVQSLRQAITQARVQPLVIVEPEVAVDPLARFRDPFVVLQIHLFIFQRPPQSLDKNVVQAAPRPSMLTAMCRTSNSPVNWSLVNCDPWSLLKISG